MKIDQAARSWLVPAGVFAWGTLFATAFAFVLYRAQGLIAGIIDLNGFGLLSRNLAEGAGFSLGNGPTLRRAPFFPFLGAALLKLFGSQSPGAPDAVTYRPIIVAQCLIFGLTCVVVWALARRLFGPRVALLAAALCPLCPQSLRYVGMTEVEPLMGLFIALLAYIGLDVFSRAGPVSGAAFGLTAAAATLTKPIVLLYPPAFLVLAGWHWSRAPAAPPIRGRVTTAVALGAAFALPLVPWVCRNLVVSGGRFAGISSNGPGEFLRGYVNAQPKYYLLRQDFGGTDPSAEKWDPEANAYEDRLLREHGSRFHHFNFSASGESVSDPLPAGITSVDLEVEKDRIEGAEAKRRLLHEPRAFLRKFAVQLGTFWYVVETRKKSMLVGAIAIAALGLACAGLARARSEGATVLPVVAVIVYFNVIYAAFLAFARYSMPLYPSLMVLAAGGLASLFARRRAEQTAPPLRQEVF